MHVISSMKYSISLVGEPTSNGLHFLSIERRSVTNINFVRKAARHAKHQCFFYTVLGLLINSFPNTLCVYIGIQ